MFDSQDIPLQVMRRESVEWVNELVGRLRDRTVNRIVLQDPVTRFRLVGMIDAYRQACLYRCLHLTEASAALLRVDHGLAAMIMARSLIETIAAFVWFQRKLEGIVSEGDLQKVYHFVRGVSFATRLEPLIEKAGTVDVKAVNVLTQVDGLETFRIGIRDDYDHLCESTHPNALGTLLLFGRHDQATDVVTLVADDQFPDESFKWTVVAARMLEHFEHAFDAVEKQFPRLRKLGTDAAKRQDASE